MREHRLRREITATQVVNNVLHGGGTTFAFRLNEEMGALPSETARAYAVARDVFEMRPLWTQIEDLDNRVDAAAQIRMLLEGRTLVERATRWLLRNRRRPLPIAATVAFFEPGTAALYRALPRLLDVEQAEELAVRLAAYTQAGVPVDVAQRSASLAPMFSALDIVEVAHQLGLDVEAVAAVHFGLGARLHLHWLRARISELPRDDRWNALARAALREDLNTLHRSLTAEVVRGVAFPAEAPARIDAWVAGNPAAERCLVTLADIQTGLVFDLTTLAVGVREVRNLIQASGG